MPYVNIPNSNLVPSIASSIGNVQGKNFLKMSRNIDRNLDRFKEEVPSNIESIANNLNALQTRNEAILDRVRQYRKMSSRLRSTSSSISGILRVLKTLPIPGISLTAGATTTFADTLHLVKEISTQLKEDADGIELITSSRIPFNDLTSNRSKLVKLDILLELTTKLSKIKNNLSNEQVNSIEECIRDFANSTGNEFPECFNLVSEVFERNSITLRERERDLPEEDVFDEERIETESGQVLVIRITEVPSKFKLTPLKKAIAVDGHGKEVYSSEASFSEDPKVLVEELKFKIKNQL